MGGMGGMVHNGMGQGGMGGMMNGGMGCAMDGCPGPVFMSLLNHHTKIQRETKDTDTGIWSRTTSDDPEVAALIKTHVQQMNALLESCAKGQCTHTPRYFDPLFRAVYKNADKIDMQVRVALGGPLGQPLGTGPCNSLALRVPRPACSLPLPFPPLLLSVPCHSSRMQVGRPACATSNAEST